MGQMPTSISSHNVQNNVKTLNDLRHSPGVMRRQLSLISNHHPSNHSQNSHVIIFLVLSFLFPLSLAEFSLIFFVTFPKTFVNTKKFFDFQIQPSRHLLDSFPQEKRKKEFA
jgi:hypothetical protein